MSLHILIIGGGLSGLTTAYRLTSLGYRVSLVDKGLLGDTPSPVFPELGTTHVEQVHAFPFILHRFQDSVKALLQELGTASMYHHDIPVPFEFVQSDSRPIAFRHFPVPKPFHWLFGLLTFRALSIKDRWSLLNMVEKLWEGATEFPQDFESQTTDCWLSSLGQSVRARREVWNPLCQLLLGDSLSQSSAHLFKAILMRGFLSNQGNHDTWIPPLGEHSFLLNPLYNHLKQKGVTFYSRKEVSYFRGHTQRITGVSLQDGTTLTADVYVSAIPPQTLMACLPERLLAKFSYFCSLSNLISTPAIIAYVHLAHFSSRPRLLLSPHSFHWIMSRPLHPPHAHTTMFTCVSRGNESLLNQSDDHIINQALADIRSACYPEVPNDHYQPLGIHIIRLPYCSLSPHPSLSAHRPVQRSPLSNFYLTGPWTETGLPASRESSIISGYLCAQSIAASTLSQNVDNLILQS